MDTQIDRRFKEAWHVFTDNAAALVLGALAVCLASVLVIPGPWVALNLLGEVSESLKSGRKVRWQATYERTSTFFPAWGLALTAGLAVGIGFGFCVVPGVLLAVAWFHAPVLVARGQPVISALGESFRRLHRSDDWVATLLNGLVLVGFCAASSLTAVLTLLALPLSFIYLALCTAQTPSSDGAVSVVAHGAAA